MQFRKDASAFFVNPFLVIVQPAFFVCADYPLHYLSPLFLAHCIIIQRFRCEIFEFFPKDNFPVFDDDEKVVLTENNCQVVKIFYQTKKSNTPKLLQENLHNFPLGSSYIINSLQYTGHNHLK